MYENPEGAAARRAATAIAAPRPRRSWRDVLRYGDGIIGSRARPMMPLDEGRLLAAAMRRTGLSDFGDPSFCEPLRRLLHSLETESRLTFLGRIGARSDIVQMLVNRLEIERDRVRYPEIPRQEIRRPLFITGLPRSGSTFLHGILAEDPGNRVPHHWETREPSPPPESSGRGRDARIARAARQLRWFYRLAPDFRRIHPIEPEMPEECVVILSHSFLSFQFSSTFDVPSYQSWLEAQDLTPAYAFHRRFLQHLQSRWGGDRWVLKAPPHLPALDALFRVYPDADVVMTHRDPLEVVASVSSLHFVLRRTFCREIDALRIGPEVAGMLAQDIERGIRARDDGDAPSDRILDVRYADLMDEPLAVVRRIYRHFDIPLSEVASSRMRAYVASRPKDRYGAHVYSLGEFGLLEAVESARYRPYRERFGV
ncbi:MAG TPA: sulfotransferase [Candidatus Binatia bacterium]|nr:sulfotransferase [Candidatus Binatia bacterium]